MTWNTSTTHLLANNPLPRQCFHLIHYLCSKLSLHPLSQGKQIKSCLGIQLMDVPAVLPRNRRIIRLAILGDGSVGKTAILRYLKGLPFQSAYKMTIGADFIVKRLQYKDRDLTLQIFDVGGQPQFSSLRSRYYGQAEGVVIVFDLMRRQTFDSIPIWLEEILETNNWKFLPLLLIGNKEDLGTDSEYEISQEEINNYVVILQNWGLEYDSSFSVVYHETSAKTGYNVENSFLNLLDILIR